MYELCVRDKNCENEVCFYYSEAEFGEIMKDIQRFQFRAGEPLCYEIIYKAKG